MAMTQSDFPKPLNLFLVCAVHFIIGSTFYEKSKSKKVEPTYTPQFVLISFDGSKSIKIWQDIRALKDELRASSSPMNTTHYINTAYLLTTETRDQYQGPGHERGKTNIGISDGIEDIRARINEINLAVENGDEIAVHTVGHFSGLSWVKDNWVQELTTFNTNLFGLDTMYPNAHLPKLNVKLEDVIGFRAPYLDHDANLYDALHELPNYKYDSTEVALHSDRWPFRDDHGLWHIPLGTMRRNDTSVLAMDYNWYVQDTQATSTLKKGTAEWQAVYNKTLEGLRNYFKHNYEGARAPVLVGYHFEKWNDAVYWEVLKTFAHEVCGKPEVRCGTFKELVGYLDTKGVPAALSKMTATVNAAYEPELVEGEHNE